MARIIRSCYGNHATVLEDNLTIIEAIDKCEELNYEWFDEENLLWDLEVDYTEKEYEAYHAWIGYQRWLIEKHKEWDL